MTKQDCSRCPLLRKCWGVGRENNKDEAIAINLLVCRIKIGLERNRSTKLLLRLLRPKVLRTATWLQNATRGAASLDELIVEVESKIIEVIIESYRLGERREPLEFLFNRVTGGVTVWSRKYVREANQYALRHYSYSSTDDDATDFESHMTQLNSMATRGLIHSSPLEHEDPQDNQDDEQNPLYARALAIVDDGLTLNLQEYRVLRFCLDHADPLSGAPTAGLHKFLARMTGVKRKTISKHYQRAIQKVMEALGVADDVLEARGIHLIVRQERRLARLHGLETEPLTAPEVYGLTAQNGGAKVADICWAYGINDRAYHNLREKYGGMTIAEIEEALQT